MHKLYRRCMMYIRRENLNKLPNDVAVYCLSYEFGMSFKTAERIFKSQQTGAAQGEH